MNAWSVLINSLTDKPENYPIVPKRGNPHIKEMQALKRGEAQETVLRAIAEFGGAATADDINELIPHRSYKYITEVCRKLVLAGKLTTYMLSDGYARRKYWKLSSEQSRPD